MALVFDESEFGSYFGFGFFPSIIGLLIETAGIMQWLNSPIGVFDTTTYSQCLFFDVDSERGTAQWLNPDLSLAQWRWTINEKPSLKIPTLFDFSQKVNFNLPEQISVISVFPAIGLTSSPALITVPLLSINKLAYMPDYGHYAFMSWNPQVVPSGLLPQAGTLLTHFQRIKAMTSVVTIKPKALPNTFRFYKTLPNGQIVYGTEGASFSARVIDLEPEGKCFLNGGPKGMRLCTFNTDDTLAAFNDIPTDDQDAIRITRRHGVAPYVSDATLIKLFPNAVEKDDEGVPFITTKVADNMQDSTGAYAYAIVVMVRTGEVCIVSGPKDSGKKDDSQNSYFPVPVKWGPAWAEKHLKCPLAFVGPFRKWSLPGMPGVILPAMRLAERDGIAHAAVYQGDFGAAKELNTSVIHYYSKDQGRSWKKVGA